jgi:hypothetical protein
MHGISLRGSADAQWKYSGSVTLPQPSNPQENKATVALLFSIFLVLLPWGLS